MPFHKQTDWQLTVFWGACFEGYCNHFFGRGKWIYSRSLLVLAQQPLKPLGQHRIVTRKQQSSWFWINPLHEQRFCEQLGAFYFALSFIYTVANFKSLEITIRPVESSTNLFLLLEEAYHAMVCHWYRCINSEYVFLANIENRRDNGSWNNQRSFIFGVSNIVLCS